MERSPAGDQEYDQDREHDQEDRKDGYRLGGTNTSHAQPARKHNPPSGVMAPSQRRFVIAITYRLPLNKTMPTTKSQLVPRFVVAGSRNTNKARGWIKR